MKLDSVHRRIAKHKVCAYKSVSYAAVAVVAGMPPIRLKANERVEIYGGLDREEARRNLVGNWQWSWSADVKRRWTHRLIPNVEAWISRKHDDVGHRLCQVLTGHGSFDGYLYKWKRKSTGECQICGTTPDTAEHAVYECDAWHAARCEANVYLGATLTVENTVAMMLSNKKNWRRINGLVEKIMATREEVERTKERDPFQDLAAQL
ncbi:Hypothetical protein CINCED_3A011091 [Cinara cedri]|uniref:Reverse transcriptase n=1 Tax=Cinara cedri TaxID=506608 RepID=A0A5E4N3Q5_9HEMI|nr:Hypothetical protein CINCED_3A011091 [Cinara cedri]